MPMDAPGLPYSRGISGLPPIPDMPPHRNN